MAWCRYVELTMLGVLQIEKVIASDQGSYRCIATNEARSRRSNNAALVVSAATDAGQLPLVTVVCCQTLVFPV